MLIKTNNDQTLWILLTGEYEVLRSTRLPEEWLQTRIDRMEYYPKNQSVHTTTELIPGRLHAFSSIIVILDIGYILKYAK